MLGGWVNSMELNIDSLTITRTLLNGEVINPISRGSKD